MQYLAIDIAFAHFPSLFDILLSFMNIQMRYFSYRTRSLIDLSYNITGPITNCHNDSLGLKLVHLWNFNDFFPFFMKINEYANTIICITYQRKKKLCLCFKMRPCSVEYDK